MKKIMELLQNMKAKNEKKDNKGFSLVELIIVIAIMAILVGIVGTQVLPYLNKSKEEKDRQILSAYTTAAVSAYGMVSDQLTTDVTVAGTKITVNVYSPAASDADAKLLSDKIKELMGKGYTDEKSKMTSAQGKKATAITITYDFDKQTVETEATGTSIKKVSGDL